MSIAVYAGTFDPITLGHLSVIRRAAHIFSHVRVLVAVNPDKSPAFTGDERVNMIKQIIVKMPNVSVDFTDRYVVHYAREIGANFLVRGIRNATDAEFETKLAHENRNLEGFDTILLPADAGYSQISSSELKRQIREHGFSDACPQQLSDILRTRLLPKT